MNRGTGGQTSGAGTVYAGSPSWGVRVGAATSALDAGEAIRLAEIYLAAAGLTVGPPKTKDANPRGPVMADLRAC